MLGFVLMLALAASSFAMPRSQVGSGDRMRDLLEAAFDYMHKQMEHERPPRIKFDRRRPPFGDFVKADGEFEGKERYGVTNGVLNVVQTDPESLTAQFNMVYPNSTGTFDYKIDGEVNGKRVRGEGEFRIQVLNSTLAMKNLRLVETNTKALRIQSLGISFDIDDILFSVDGLTVEDMTVPEFEKSVASAAMNSWNSKYKQEVEKRVEGSVPMINRAIGERTLEECIQWLKDHKGESDLP